VVARRSLGREASAGRINPSQPRLPQGVQRCANELHGTPGFPTRSAERLNDGATRILHPPRRISPRGSDDHPNTQKPVVCWGPRRTPRKRLKLSKNFNGRQEQLAFVRSPLGAMVRLPPKRRRIYDEHPQLWAKTNRKSIGSCVSSVSRSSCPCSLACGLLPIAL